MRVTVTLTSDFICPWCFIGERRLAQAIASLPKEVVLDLVWRPFELNPDMPAQGMSRQAYRTAKFGSWERSQAMDAEVAANGKASGIAFNYDRVTRTPNTFAAHRLMWLAGEIGDACKLADLLFSTYFTEGRDLSDPAMLRAIAAEAGLPANRVAAVIDRSEGSREVRALEAEAYRSGISGVPLLRIGPATVSGVQPASVIAVALRRAANSAPLAAD